VTLTFPKKDESQKYDVGDYVTLNDPQQAGVVYRVDRVRTDERYASLSNYTLRPVYGAFDAADRRGVRTERPSEMVKLDLVRAGIEHIKMQNFIRNVAKHYGDEGDGTG
jgi:hypothetical protein